MDLCYQEYELVKADSELVVANAQDNSDLFYAVPMSYGTLGFLTSVKVKVIPYRPYMKITYRPTYSLEDTMKVFNKETHKGTL